MSYAEQLTKLQSELQDSEKTEEQAFNRLLGYNLAKAREKRGWLQKNLADLMGVTQSAWSRVETGNAGISLYDLTRASQILEVRIGTLIPRYE